jgi:3',5'-cyclic AMP phosphodiesterase CpdA
MKKILHISDIHYGIPKQNENFGIICNILENKKIAESEELIIVITGDLVNDANKKNDYQNIKSKIDFLNQCGYNDILIVPGNHDYGTGSRGNKKFVKYFKKTFLKPGANYPLIDIIDDIAFIGLDSMAEELHWYDRLWAEGEIGFEQLNRLKNILGKDEVISCKKRVIYLHHHPFDKRPLHQLKDSFSLGKVLKECIRSNVAIDAILYGHNHEGKSQNGFWGINRCYDAGSATMKPRNKILEKFQFFNNVKNATRLINLEKPPIYDLKIDFNYR